MKKRIVTIFTAKSYKHKKNRDFLTIIIKKWNKTTPYFLQI